MPLHQEQDGYSLIELLIVVVVIGILAAIAIPRFLSQQERANDAAAVSDLRNLVAVEVALEATDGLSDSRADILAAWSPTDDRIVACAQLSPDEDDVTLIVGHMDGSVTYSWQRSSGAILSADAVLSACPAGTTTLT